MTAELRVAVIGGGITGLAAAWELSSDPSVSVHLLEAAPRVGGKIHTTPFAGRLVDEGADAFLRRVPDAVALAGELGLTDRLVSPAVRQACVWIDGSLRRLPDGLVMGVPVRFDGVTASGILSEDGLDRLRAEPNLAGDPLEGDATVGSVIRRRLGDEVLERLVGPLVGGINAGEPDEMSIDAVVPQLAAGAHRHRSIIEGLRAVAAPPSDEPVFATPLGGMSEFIDALEAHLRTRGVEIRLGTPIDALEPVERERTARRWRITTAAGSDEFDGVVLTVPAGVAGRLVEAFAPTAAEHLAAIESASVAMVTVAYRSEDVPVPLDASGFLVPRDAGLSITAVSWASSKWAHLAGGDVILRVSIGHHRDPAPLDLDDDDLVATVEHDLHTTMGIDAPPRERRVSRFVDGLPQYGVGHLDRVAEIDAAMAAAADRVVVTGAAFRGVGIPACIRQGRDAATTLRRRLGS